MKGWTAELQAQCAEACAAFGDPPCQSVVPDCQPCPACLRACGFEPAPPPLDPDAVVRDLL